MQLLLYISLLVRSAVVGDACHNAIIQQIHDACKAILHGALLTSEVRYILTKLLYCTTLTSKLRSRLRCIFECLCSRRSVMTSCHERNLSVHV